MNSDTVKPHLFRLGNEQIKIAEEEVLTYARTRVC